LRERKEPNVVDLLHPPLCILERLSVESKHDVAAPLGNWDFGEDPRRSL
jgi:hypothetical protein